MKKNILVTYHPVTLENNTSALHFKEILSTLSTLKDTKLIFTYPNSDANGRIIIKMINKFITTHKADSVVFPSMGHINYLSVLKYVDCILGNSSSGLLEAPSLKIGTINIGDRQKGRLKADSIIDCSPTKKSIFNALTTLYSNEFQKILNQVSNPYGEGKATEKIITVLKSVEIPYELKKYFYNL